MQAQRLLLVLQVRALVWRWSWNRCSNYSRGRRGATALEQEPELDGVGAERLAAEAQAVLSHPAQFFLTL